MPALQLGIRLFAGHSADTAPLIEVVQLQAKELEKLVAHVEQVTTRLPYQHQFALAVSELSELHQRIKKMKV